MHRRGFLKAGMAAGAVVSFPVAGTPQQTGKTHRIYSDNYSDQFAATREPLLRISSGDTVETRTLDAGGRDYKGIAHCPDPFGYPGLSNALTGPFYVEGAEYGDALEVRLDKVRLNRNWGYTNYRLMPFVLNPNTIESVYKDVYKPDAVWAGRDNLIPWDLDLEQGVASPRLLQRSRMKFIIPVRPMLGCIGVAAPGDNAGTADISGSWGGNMDYNDVVEGATLRFPVYHAGAYLYVGDGHALQGDGEGLGMGIETSMDVQFTVKVLKGMRLSMPRLKNSTHIVSIASQPEWSSNLEQGLQNANSDMIQWLTTDYELTPPEAHLLLGTAVQHKVVTYSGSAVAMIERKYLPQR
jgi:acetamidase/formamidase